MTGAYAQEWPGRGARESQWGRGCGPEGRGRYGDREGGPRGRHGRHEGGGFPVEALMGWAMARGKGAGGPHRHGPRGLDPEDLERIEELVALRRMRGRGGPGPFGRGPRGRGRGRARRGDVRLAVLRLLADEPRNGYQLMQAIEERSDGQWRPSPGSMYPTLSQLEDEGLIGSTASEGSRQFTITDAGHEHLQTRAGEPDPWTPVQDADETAMSELGPLVIAIGKAVWQVASVGDEAQRTRATELLAETRRGLYRILAEDPSGDAGDTADDDAVGDDPEAPGEAGTSEG